MTEYEDLPRETETKSLIVDQIVFPINYNLLTPVTVDGEKIEKVVVREPTVLDVEIAYREKAEFDKIKRILAQVMELKPDDIKQFGSRDFSRLGELVVAFL